MPAEASGPQAEAATRLSICNGRSGGWCSSTCSGCAAEPGRASGWAWAAVSPSSAETRSIRRRTGSVTMPSLPRVMRSSVASLPRMVSSYCGRLSPMRITCEPITAATAESSSASAATAVHTERVWPRPMRRRPLISGVTRKPSITARVIGISTSRAKYSSASRVAVPSTPSRRLCTVEDGGSTGPPTSIGSLGVGSIADSADRVGPALQAIYRKARWEGRCGPC